MKKYLKTTLGRKLLAFYLVLFAITFCLITTVGRDYISERVESESISNLRSVGITLLGSHINEQRYPLPHRMRHRHRPHRILDQHTASDAPRP